MWEGCDWSFHCQHRTNQSIGERRRLRARGRGAALCGCGMGKLGRQAVDRDVAVVLAIASSPAVALFLESSSSEP